MRLHGLPQFIAIAEGRLGPGEYAGLLAALHRYHRTVARAAERGGLTPLSSSRRRCELLEADLASLSACPDPVAPMWTQPSPAALYGALYVAEGSALGGKVIARQLDYLLGAGSEGRSFFRGDADTGQRWRGFLKALARGTGEADRPQLLAGAEASFALFERCVAP